MALELKALPGRCEEASTLSGEVYIPCNAPATQVVEFRRGDRVEGPYRMCTPCAIHNLRNRGASYVRELGPDGRPERADPWLIP